LTNESNQQALRLPLSFLSAGQSMPVETDDTAFVTASKGFILFADKGLNTVFKLSRAGFIPGSAYTAADGGPFVGAPDIASGVITPIVTGFVGPGGLVFVTSYPCVRNRPSEESAPEGIRTPDPLVRRRNDGFIVCYFSTT
jgi:hypothetical protein